MKLLIRHSPHVILAIALAFAAPVSAQRKPPTGAKPQLTVYKSPTCGCCAKWVDYMQANGFTAAVTNLPDVTAVKIKHGVPRQLASCHTTLVGGYVIEGHVPVEDVRRLLKDKPANVIGLAAPGMPAGSPGMDVPNSPPYDVVAFDRNGGTKIYATHK
jgi:hypothetical protein